MENEKDIHRCPVGIAQRVISGKWKIVIIFLLKDGVLRFNELQRIIPEIRRAYLTQQLRELEADGLVHREVYKVVPPKVEYSLTEIGMKFLDVISAIEKWGADYIEIMAQA
jgi:DNA-binding HxlR family transcriptional regulator